MRKSIASKFAAALILSTLVPLAAMAQDATTPPNAATKTPATTAKVTAPQRNTRKITSRYMMGNRPVATRGTSWRNRQFHRGMPYGRTHAGTRTAQGNMPAGNAVTANSGAATGTATMPNNASATAKKAGGAHHKHHSGKHRATQTSHRHVAQHSGKAARGHTTNFSHRR